MQQLQGLQKATKQAMERLEITAKQERLRGLEDRAQAPDFWNNPQAAQLHMQQAAALRKTIEPWIELRTLIDDALELAAMHDPSLENDLQQAAEQAQAIYESLKQQLLYSGPYDDHNAILSIYAGAGGTDAQDWAEMLLRMYVRWAEKSSDTSVEIIEQSAGEEAGLKSVTFVIKGPYAYARLKGEHGVHRLVRLSPFNADSLRQTSFAKVDVLPEIDAPDEVVLDEKDLKVDVYRAGGHGGQSVNTTDSAVRVTHIPTGIAVAIQNERSQLQNKETALTILRSRLAQLQLEQHAESIRELKGPNEQAAWGNQIRNYVLHPYTMVKDTRTKYETSDVQRVLDGGIDDFTNAYLEQYAVSA